LLARLVSLVAVGWSNLTSRDVHNKLGELGRVVRAFGVFGCHASGGRRRSTFIVPSSNGFGLLLGVSRGLFCLICHAYNMA